VPRALIPAVKAIERDYRNQAAHGQTGERPLYADNDEEEKA